MRLRIEVEIYHGETPGLVCRMSLNNGRKGVVDGFDYDENPCIPRAQEDTIRLMHLATLIKNLSGSYDLSAPLETIKALRTDPALRSDTQT